MKDYYWLFDLDNTLHRADFGIFQLINQEMTYFIARELGMSLSEASELRNMYWEKYGATLSGLQKHYPEINVLDFLKESHPLDKILPLLVVERDLPQTLNQIHGDKFIFSNAPHFYVDAIIEELQLEQFFKNIYACDDLGLKYKPEHTVYQNLLDDIGVSANDCIMIDDSVSNLQTAKDKGMKTVLIETSVQNIKQDFIDLSINSLQELADKQILLF